MSIETSGTTTSSKVAKLTDQSHGKNLNAAGTGSGQSQALGFFALLGSIDLQAPEDGDQGTDAAVALPAQLGSQMPDSLPGMASVVAGVSGGDSANASAQAASHELVMWLAQQSSSVQIDSNSGAIPATQASQISQTGQSIRASQITLAVSADSATVPEPSIGPTQIDLSAMNDLPFKIAGKEGGKAASQLADNRGKGLTQLGTPGIDVPPVVSVASDSLTIDAKSKAGLHPVVSRLLAQEASVGADGVSKSPEKADVRLASGQNQLTEVLAPALPASSAPSKATESATRQAEILFQRQILLTEGVHQSSASAQTVGMGDSLIRPAERAQAKSGSGSGSSTNGDASWGYLALRDAGRKDAPVPTSEAVSVSSDWQVAQTVNYWVTQGVQNAELKLDGFGGQAVEVSISLKGDQAQVGFRTDQPEIRQMLEGAVTQLKDLLSNQGLVLSGVSVGNSAQQGAQQQEQRNSQGVRRMNIAVVEAVAEPARTRVVGPAGQSVDLFV